VSVECDEEPVKHVVDAIGDDDRLLDRFFRTATRSSRGRWESVPPLPISEESKRKILRDILPAAYTTASARTVRGGFDD